MKVESTKAFAGREHLNVSVRHQLMDKDYDDYFLQDEEQREMVEGLPAGLRLIHMDVLR